MGINTGYCSVGNFGSADRMDYTILGAEVNLSARLQVFSEHSTGLDLYLDLGRIDEASSETVRTVLHNAIAALDQQQRSKPD